MPNKTKESKFNIGEVVTHRNLRYTAIIIDIDPIFQASAVYNPLVKKYKFATENLWYRLLVNNTNQETYVKESMLSKSLSTKTINNPRINIYLKKQNGVYSTKKSKH